MEGPHSLGKALWSPQTSKDGKDIYRSMRDIKQNDVVFHFIDNKGIEGISVVQSSADDTFTGLSGTEWADVPAYRIELRDYTKLKENILRQEFLQDYKHQRVLDKLLNEHKGLFFNRRYELNQGAYLTEAPVELVKIWNEIYYIKTGENLPYIDENDVKQNKVVPIGASVLKIKECEDITKSAGLIFNVNLIARFVASLCTKPFVILTGLSGSGKTKLAQAFAQWICADKSQYRIVPVGADWTNREPLLGYPNALEEGNYVKPNNGVIDLIVEAGNNPGKPFFLILDEMNLSHAERYFADFLSAMELGEMGEITLHTGGSAWNGVPSSVKLSKNTFIIGTVNIDETTYMFSPKVLDRANVIEFRVSGEEMAAFLENPAKPDIEKLAGAGSGMAADFVAIAESDVTEFRDKEKINAELTNFFKELKKIGAEFGYRTASEIYRFAGQLDRLTAKEGKKWKTDDVIDAAVIQKLLPKVHGSRSKLDPILKALATLCLADKNESNTLFKEPWDFDSIPKDKIRFPLSLEKIIRMRRRVIQDGFTSFAEA